LLRLAEHRPGAFLLLGLLLIGPVLVATGYQLGVRSEAPHLAAVHAENSLETRRQQAALADLRSGAANHLDALALRLGDLQSRVLRLDALGQRLVMMADLDLNEFDFTAAPGRGGLETSESTADGYALPLPLPLEHELAALAATLADRQLKLELVEESVRSRELGALARPQGRPVDDAWISSGFGMRNDPFTGRRQRHHGVDLAGHAGSDVNAVASGVVIWSGRRSGYGNLVEVDHGDGYLTRYAHNRKNLVTVGEPVAKGTTHAEMGSSGR